jgi:hypothetical protein
MAILSMQPALAPSINANAAAPRPIMGILEFLIQNRTGLDLALPVFVIATGNSFVSQVGIEFFHLVMGVNFVSCAGPGSAQCRSPQERAPALSKPNENSCQQHQFSHFNPFLFQNSLHRLEEILTAPCAVLRGGRPAASDQADYVKNQKNDKQNPGDLCGGSR